MTIEAYRFNVRKEEEVRRSAKQGMEFCKIFIDNKLPFGTFRTVNNERIFTASTVSNPGVMKFNTNVKEIINKIDEILKDIKVIDKKVVNDCYYVLIDCGSLPII